MIIRRYKCDLCGKIMYGLMSFASHVAQEHGISAIEYWNTYGHNSEKGNINPSRRKQDG